jgi:penicillin G amidase
MKTGRAVVSLLLAGLVFWALDNRHGTFPALGRLLDPFTGFWQNGSRVDRIPRKLIIPGLRDEVRVVWDDRRVSHIFAGSDHDLYLAQGYVAASLRLWQMEFQALYTAGRISEVVGPLGVPQDIFNRRFGLAWAAERTLDAFRGDPRARETIEAFTAGVNAYIRSLGRRRLPVEYKILDYRPEPWTDLKCALLLKAMSYTLASGNRDAAMTAARVALGEETVDRLFPFFPPLVEPVIPPGTVFEFEGPASPAGGSGAGGTDGTDGEPPASGRPEPPDPLSSGFLPGPGVGSNNWAVSGRLTRNGFPILCNDMHLELALPAIWYEVQLAAPGVNVRGVAFPSVPLVIAGYNEAVAWGFTNGGSDVLDWYAVTFKDDTRAEYLYGGQWRKTTVREERIAVRGGRTVVDRVVHTHHGPVVRWADEPPFPGMDVPAGAALRWVAHDPSNEIASIYALNRARSYEDCVEALGMWDCPAQNIVFADRDGTIAIRHNGKFPLRRKGQGRYVLDGSDPADDWPGWVPHAHVPAVKDPERGFVSSANQLYAGPGYPYYLGWDYISYERGARINEILAEARDLTPEDMIRMQADVLDIRARAVIPRLLELLEGKPAGGTEETCFAELRAWNFEAQATSMAPTVFRELWAALNRLTWDDEKKEDMGRMPRPASEILVDLVLNDPGSEFFDDRSTPERETLAEIAERAWRAAVGSLEKSWGPPGPSWEWGKVKGTRLGHLARIPGFGLEGLEVDGAGHVINAIERAWAPSWRMVVELGPEVRAWANCPGGQSGHPGSRFYDDSVDDWAACRLTELVFLRSADEPHPAVAGRTVMRGER